MLKTTRNKRIDLWSRNRFQLITFKRVITPEFIIDYYKLINNNNYQNYINQQKSLFY